MASFTTLLTSGGWCLIFFLRGVARIPRPPPSVLRLKPTHDIAAELGRMKQPGQRIVAFALETDNEEANAKDKLRRKNADFIVLNSTRIPGTTFQSDDNQITIITANDATAYPKKPKREVAADIIDRLSQLLA